jgi:hypothetical protein
VTSTDLRADITEAATPRPPGRPRTYGSARGVDLFICPRMGQMHHFAGTHELFWRRMETWVDWVRATRD